MYNLLLTDYWNIDGNHVTRLSSDVAFLSIAKQFWHKVNEKQAKLSKIEKVNGWITSLTEFILEEEFDRQSDIVTETSIK